MTTTTAPCERRVAALCSLMGHDAGPDACRDESCLSATIVGLHTAAGLARAAAEVLEVGGATPARSDVARLKLRLRNEAAWAADEVRARAGVWWRQAEQILNGDDGTAWCPLHELTAQPCGSCGEEEE